MIRLSLFLILALTILLNVLSAICTNKSFDSTLVMRHKRLIFTPLDFHSNQCFFTLISATVYGYHNRKKSFMETTKSFNSRKREKNVLKNE